MKADEKFIFFAVTIVFFIVATLMRVKAEIIFIIIGIILSLYYSYGDLNKI
ncbi:MAG: hypothetical protein ABH876_00075 [Patescibacteria group bacterium]